MFKLKLFLYLYCKIFKSFLFTFQLFEAVHNEKSNIGIQYYKYLGIIQLNICIHLIDAQGPIEAGIFPQMA